MFSKNYSAIYKLFLIVFFAVGKQANKIKLEKVYSNLLFVPLDGSETVNLLNKDSKFMMQRSTIINDSYFQTIFYFPPKPGIIYYQNPENHRIFYDFISSEFPFIYYHNSKSNIESVDSLKYKDFINDQTHAMDIWGFAEIQKYYASYEFEDDADTEFLANGSSHEFHIFSTKQSETVDFSRVTTDFQNEFWRNARSSVANISVDLTTLDTYGEFFRSVIKKGMNKIDVIFKKKLTEQADLESWNSSYQEVLSDLTKTTLMVDLLCAPVKGQSDRLAIGKEALVNMFANDTNLIFNGLMVELKNLFSLDIPLTTALYYKAKFNAYFLDDVGLPDTLIENANKALANPNWDNHYFVNIISKLNYKLLSIIFADYNQIWVNSVVNKYIQAIYVKLEAMLMEPINKYKQLLIEKYQIQNDVFDSFNIQNYLRHRLIDAHPNFVKLSDVFAYNISRLINDFYKANSGLIEKYKQRPGLTNEAGTGNKAFTFQFYRVGLKEANPTKKLVQLQTGELFFDFSFDRRRRVLV